MKKRSVKIAGHSTSITLEEPFWRALKDLADEQDISLNELVTRVDKARKGNLSSALRVYVLGEMQKRLLT
jgi:predicted DNA-binding ribbon-helix-helix protein